jgi:hypothetical protein
MLNLNDLLGSAGSSAVSLLIEPIIGNDYYQVATGGLFVIIS